MIPSTSDPLRIALVTIGDPDRITGGYLYHRRIAESAAEHDAEVAFVSVLERLFPLAVTAVPTVVRGLREQRPDVVVIDSLAAALIAPWARRIEVPLVAMVHQPPGGIGHGFARRSLQSSLDRRLYRRCALVLVASGLLADSLAEAGVAEDRVRVLPPGTDVGPRLEPVSGLRDGRAIAVLCVAHLIENKGIIELLEAVALLPEHLITLHLVGETQREPRYWRRVERRLSRFEPGRVTVHGPLPPERLPAMYAGADAFVLPSNFEAYATAAAEAMAAGLPVVGWNAGNLPYLITNGREGILAPAGDVDGLGAGLRRLAEDEDLRRRLGEAAHKRAERFPTWDETAARFFASLRAVIDDE